MAEGELAAVAAEHVPGLPGQRDSSAIIDEVQQRRPSARTAAPRRARRRLAAIGARPLSCPRSEQALRPEQQHRDEDQEDADLAQRLAENRARPGTRPRRSAGRRPARPAAAHAAEHDDGEGHQHEAIADLRIDVVGRHQQAGGGAPGRPGRCRRSWRRRGRRRCRQARAPCFSLATARIAWPRSVSA